MSQEKVYLGDAVYAKNDGVHIVLTAENGIFATNTIYLEASVVGALADYLRTQFGASLAPPWSVEEAPSVHSMLKPQVHTELAIYVSAICGITETMVKKANCFAEAHANVINAIQAAGVEPLGCRVNTADLNIDIVGTGKDLGTVWGVLRKLGFEFNGHRPDDDSPEWSGTFRRDSDGCSVYIKFSSTVCTRVQVGTEMVESPIYETRCSKDETEEDSNDEPDSDPF